MNRHDPSIGRTGAHGRPSETAARWVELRCAALESMSRAQLECPASRPIAARKRELRLAHGTGIMERAVGRGLTRRTVELPEALAVAEMEVDSIPESFAVTVPVCDVLEHLDDGVEGLGGGVGNRYFCGQDDATEVSLDHTSDGCVVPDLHGGFLDTESPPRPRRLGWAKLLARVFAVAVTLCRKCGGQMRILEVVETADDIDRVLHGARAPPRLRHSPRATRSRTR